MPRGGEGLSRIASLDAAQSTGCPTEPTLLDKMLGALLKRAWMAGDTDGYG